MAGSTAAGSNGSVVAATNSRCSDGAIVHSLSIEPPEGLEQTADRLGGDQRPGVGHSQDGAAVPGRGAGRILADLPATLADAAFRAGPG